MSTPEPRRVVVDDSDPSIHYTGPWFQDADSKSSIGNFGQTYLGTLHGTNSNASIAFAFNGSQVQISGTNNVLNTSGTFDPTWECYIDKIKIGTTPPQQTAENNRVLCEQDELVDGPHVITLNATVKKQTFWFDQIQYVPSSSVALDQQAIYVDNTDPALTDAFGHGWAVSGNGTNMTTQTNSTFTMNFTGVSVTWYGVVFPNLGNSPARGSYVVNGESPHAFQLEGLSPGEVPQYNQIFFQTPPYNEGQHTMVVTYLGNTNTTPLTLDYLIIQNGTQLRNATASPTSSTHTLGPVVGGVLGGIALVILTAVGFILYRRRKKKNGKITQPAGGSESIVQPFQYIAPNATTSQFLASSVQGSQALNSKTRTRGEGTNVASTSVAPNRSRMIMDEGPANHRPQRLSMTDVSEMPPSYSDL